MPYPYRREFRRYVLDLVVAGRSVTSIAADHVELVTRVHRDGACRLAAPSHSASFYVTGVSLR